MRILAIDPGTEQTAYVIYEYEPGEEEGRGVILKKDILQNDQLLGFLIAPNVEEDYEEAFIEMIGFYGKGMPAGVDVFETCIWIGRFIECIDRNGKPAWLVKRASIKAEICGSARAKDSNVMQALLDLLGPKGTKKNPGPTFGVKSHIWAALAVAVAAARGVKRAKFTR